MGKRYFIRMSNSDNSPLGSVTMDADYYSSVASDPYINYIMDQNFNHLFQELYQSIFINEGTNPTAKMVGLKLLSVGHDIIGFGMEDNFKCLLQRFISMHSYIPRFTFLQKFLYRVLTSPNLGKCVINPFLQLFLPIALVNQLLCTLSARSNVINALPAFIVTPNTHTAVRTYTCSDKMYNEVFGKNSNNIPRRDEALQLFKTGVVAALLELHLTSDASNDVVKDIISRKIPDNPAFHNFMNDVSRMNLSISYAEAACYIIVFIGIHPTHFNSKDLDTIFEYYLIPMFSNELTPSKVNQDLLLDTWTILCGLGITKWSLLKMNINSLRQQPNYFDMFTPPFNPVIPVKHNEWQQPMNQMGQQVIQQSCRCHQCGNFQPIPTPIGNKA